MITGDEIRRGRELLGLTQSELGKRIGVSHRTIGNWERDETSPQRYEARLRELFRGQHPAPSTSIADYSDTELLLEVSRRMSEQRTRRDRSAAQPQPLPDDPPVASHAQPDGATTRPSDPRLTLLSDDTPDLRGLPFAADEEKPGDDPGEDHD